MISDEEFECALSNYKNYSREPITMSSCERSVRKNIFAHQKVISDGIRKCMQRNLIKFLVNVENRFVKSIKNLKGKH
jgi:hypothetical protein